MSSRPRRTPKSSNPDLMLRIRVHFYCSSLWFVLKTGPIHFLWWRISFDLGNGTEKAHRGFNTVNPERLSDPAINCVSTSHKNLEKSSDSTTVWNTSGGNCRQETKEQMRSKWKKRTATTVYMTMAHRANKYVTSWKVVKLCCWKVKPIGRSFSVNDDVKKLKSAFHTAADQNQCENESPAGNKSIYR